MFDIPRCYMTLSQVMSSIPGGFPWISSTNTGIRQEGMPRLPGPSLFACLTWFQNVPKGCQFTIPWGLIGTPWKVLVLSGTQMFLAFLKCLSSIGRC